VLRDPDAIYPNAHKIVAGDEVYVRVYDKMGSNVKLAFAQDIKKHSKLISTVVITSFSADPRPRLLTLVAIQFTSEVRKPPARVAFLPVYALGRG